MNSWEHKIGPEEEYFMKLEQEKIREYRHHLNKERREREAKQDRELHWMKCPKCGCNMKEILLSGVFVDKCTACHGVFFDQGEWALLMESEKEEKPSFISTLYALLGGNRALRSQ